MDKWTVEDYKQFQREQETKSKSKYRNTKVSNSHGYFDSQKEYYRYLELKSLEKNNVIEDLQRQVMFELIKKNGKERATVYFADFVYVKDGEYIVEDVKSEITRKKPDYVMKRKLMLDRHGIEILET